MSMQQGHFYKKGTLFTFWGKVHHSSHPVLVMFRGNDSESNSGSADNTKPMNIPHVVQNLTNEQHQRHQPYTPAVPKRAAPHSDSLNSSAFYGSCGSDTSQHTIPTTTNENIPPPGHFDPSRNGLNSSAHFPPLNAHSQYPHEQGPPPNGAFSDASSARPRTIFSQSIRHNQLGGLPVVPLPNVPTPSPDVPFLPYNRDTQRRIVGDHNMHSHVMEPSPDYDNVSLPPIQNQSRDSTTNLPGPQHLLNLAPPRPPAPTAPFFNQNAPQPSFFAPPHNTIIAHPQHPQQQQQLFLPQRPNNGPTRHQYLLPPPITHLGNNNAGYWGAQMSGIAQSPSAMNSVYSNPSYLYSIPPPSGPSQSPFHHVPQPSFTAPHPLDGTYTGTLVGPSRPFTQITQLGHYNGTLIGPRLTSTQPAITFHPNAPQSLTAVNSRQSLPLTGETLLSPLSQQDDYSEISLNSRSNSCSASTSLSTSTSKSKSNGNCKSPQALPAPELWTRIGFTEWRCEYVGPARPEGCTNISTTARNLTRHIRSHARREIEMNVKPEEQVAFNGLPEAMRWMPATCPLEDADLPGCRYYREHGRRWETSTMHRPEYVVKKHVKTDHDISESEPKQRRKKLQNSKPEDHDD